jgi:hypothetical protein
MGRPICEVCGKAPVKLDDILCLECSRAYSMLHELLDYFPNLEKEDLTRIKDIFEWRTKKIQTIPIQG